MYMKLQITIPLTIIVIYGSNYSWHKPFHTLHFPCFKYYIISSIPESVINKYLLVKRDYTSIEMYRLLSQATSLSCKMFAAQHPSDFNTLSLGNGNMCQWTRASMIWIITCCLFVTKPLPELMAWYFQLYTKEQNSGKPGSQHIIFNRTKMHTKLNYHCGSLSVSHTKDGWYIFA